MELRKYIGVVAQAYEEAANGDNPKQALQELASRHKKHIELRIGRHGAFLEADRKALQDKKDKSWTFIGRVRAVIEWDSVAFCNRNMRFQSNISKTLAATAIMKHHARELGR